MFKESKILKINPEHFRIPVVYWAPGTPHNAPGYHVFIKVDDELGYTHSLLLPADTPNKKWILST